MIIMPSMYLRHITYIVFICNNCLTKHALFNLVPGMVCFISANCLSESSFYKYADINAIFIYMYNVTLKNDYLLVVWKRTWARLASILHS